jgi:hypothetical protein
MSEQREGFPGELKAYFAEVLASGLTDFVSQVNLNFRI